MRTCDVAKPLKAWPRAKEGEDQARATQAPLRAQPAIRPLLLKVPPAISSASLRTTSLTHGSLEDIQDPNYHSCIEGKCENFHKFK